MVCLNGHVLLSLFLHEVKRLGFLRNGIGADLGTALLRRARPTGCAAAQHAGTKRQPTTDFAAVGPSMEYGASEPGRLFRYFIG